MVAEESLSRLVLEWIKRQILEDSRSVSKSGFIVYIIIIFGSQITGNVLIMSVRDRNNHFLLVDYFAL